MTDSIFAALKQLIRGVLPQTQRLAQYKMPIVFHSYRSGTTVFYKVLTSINPSDLLTKETDRPTFIRLATMMISNIVFTQHDM